MIGCPSYSGRVIVDWVPAVAETVALFAEAGEAPVRWAFIAQCSVIHRARRLLAARFMASDCSHLLMIDADMAWKARTALDLLRRDMQFVGVPGLRRNDRGRTWCVRPIGDEFEYSEDDGLIRLDAIGTGFLMVRRDVFESMSRAYPQLRIKEEGVPPAEAAHNYSFFQPVIRNGVEEQDDYAFCSRWRAIGGEVFADPHHELVHVKDVGMRGAMYDDVAPAAEPDGEPPLKVDLEAWAKARGGMNAEAAE